MKTHKLKKEIAQKNNLQPEEVRIFVDKDGKYYDWAMKTQGKQDEWEKKLRKILSGASGVDDERYIRLISKLFRSHTTQIVGKIENDEELWELLRNPLHSSVRNRLEKVIKTIERLAH